MHITSDKVKTFTISGCYEEIAYTYTFDVIVSKNHDQVTASIYFCCDDFDFEHIAACNERIGDDEIALRINEFEAALTQSYSDMSIYFLTDSQILRNFYIENGTYRALI